MTKRKEPTNMCMKLQLPLHVPYYELVAGSFYSAMYANSAGNHLHPVMFHVVSIDEEEGPYVKLFSLDKDENGTEDYIRNLYYLNPLKMVGEISRHMDKVVVQDIINGDA